MLEALSSQAEQIGWGMGTRTEQTSGSTPWPLRMRAFVGGRRSSVLLLATTIVLDAGSKLFAYAVLPTEERVASIGNWFSFYLTVNPTGFPSAWHRAVQTMGGDPSPVIRATIAMSVATFLECVVVLLLWRSHIRAGSKIALGLLGFLGICLVCSVAVTLVSLGTPNPMLVGLAGRAALLLLGIELLLASGTAYFQTCFTLLVAGGCGNLLSGLYLPYGVVDFICSPRLSELLPIGVFNIADLCIIASYMMLLVAPLYWLAGLVRRKAHSRPVA
jgi:lipoprotein signal peptidase